MLSDESFGEVLKLLFDSAVMSRVKGLTAPSSLLRKRVKTTPDTPDADTCRQTAWAISYGRRMFVKEDKNAMATNAMSLAVASAYWYGKDQDKDATVSKIRGHLFTNIAEKGLDEDFTPVKCKLIGEKIVSTFPQVDEMDDAVLLQVMVGAGWDIGSRLWEYESDTAKLMAIMEGS